MNAFSRFLGPIALWPLLLCPAFAGFNPAVVSGDANWVVFMDVQALRESTLGKELLTLVRKEIQPAPATGIEFDFQRLFATIGNVTAYGTNFSARTSMIDGALVIEGTGALRTIAEGWAAQASITSPKNVSEITDLPFPGYVLDQQLYVAFPPEPVILVSKSKPHLIKARDVFRGNAVSLAQNPSSPLARQVAKTGQAYGIAASVVPTDLMFAPNAPPTRILELVNSGLITLREEDQRTVLGAQLVAKSDATADKLQKIVQGLTAMMSLTETNDRQLAEFLQSAKVDRQGQTVSVQVAYSSDRLVQMIRSAQQTRPRATAATPAVQQQARFGRKLVEWKLDKAAPNAGPGPQTLGEYSIENAHLVTGSILTLVSSRSHPQGMHGLVDSVEIVPLGGGLGLRFEAENMRLMRYSPRNAPFASGGRYIASVGNFSSAQFEFPGAEGDYVIKVRYFEESTGQTTLAVHLKEPAATVEP